MIHLDTNVLVRLPELVRAGHPLIQRIADGESLAVCTQVWFEYVCGPLDAEERADVLGLLSTLEPVSQVAAELGAELFNATGRQRRQRADCLIAACAIAAGAEFWTFNGADFERFRAHGLSLQAL